MIDSLGSQLDPTGAGVQGLLQSGIAYAPPASNTQTLNGDVTGTTAQTNVVQIQATLMSDGSVNLSGLQ